jgi:hypothetical protein
MFSLIITIVAIALVVALVAATMYHGGADTLTKGKQEAEIGRSLNELGQIKAALTAYHADTGKYATSLQDLAPQYLASIPSGWGVEVPSQVAFESSRLLQGTEEQKADSCREINKRLGIESEPPSCADIDSNFSGCCVVPDAPTPPAP